MGNVANALWTMRFNANFIKPGFNKVHINPV